MSYQLRREDVVDVAGLQAMLEDSPGKAAQAILAAAGQGVVQAQLLLGQILLDGRGIEQDALLARRWFGIAAQAGNAMAHNMLGRCLEHGWGGEVNLVKAAIHYAHAADAGLDWGLYNLGNLLATGRGVAVNQAQALACYEKAAHLGHAKSMNLLGRYLEHGIATAPSPVRAVRWYRRSAEAGDFRGMFSLALVLFERGENQEALRWIELARAQGNVPFLRSSLNTLRSAGPSMAAVADGYAQEIQLREEV
ncbi:MULTISPECIES: tetratricopeptide repeat protein [Pseudomonas]|uniref:Sel1 repeat family protein n=1 Tax=Pseudomonas taiwanensis TaxID=470150 RepID=A0ABR6V4Q7_9PSED|nr:MULTISPECIES: tetratricopeptide repeat protein [Pseudomonas]AGZ36904.1 Sel1 domain-containing protein repeat-containing protein [Pseudomonas sp. VLB120]MBC3475362.1 sel1 repeat family protein [Pseudomonas taiwanensis]MBC3491148.1 sel1 repeat family protein [Pseudomonas taiwanensis]QQZ35425.1 sel1 repeat family protein [Pseudomonas sp. SK2]